ncbi:hypothetical protein OUZ56_023506 [Daphnia magna]|uniref:Uncharacterized protein n=1 Tax=Daphnia magna TaxID=35525 RepID=A0ABR0AZ76_9CRUS|nr:hypothetical protein OUZ56_023506 [Daphnia magna]
MLSLLKFRKERKRNGTGDSSSLPENISAATEDATSTFEDSSLLSSQTHKRKRFFYNSQKNYVLFNQNLLENGNDNDDDKDGENGEDAIGRNREAIFQSQKVRKAPKQPHSMPPSAWKMLSLLKFRKERKRNGTGDSSSLPENISAATEDATSTFEDSSLLSSQTHKRKKENMLLDSLIIATEKSTRCLLLRVNSSNVMARSWTH